MHSSGLFKNLILAALLVVGSASSAFAQFTFNVDSLLDEPDLNPGDLLCVSDPSNVCTLRAALTEANYTLGADFINLTLAGTYTLSVGADSEDLGLEGDLDVFDDVQIEGLGPTQSIIDANGIDRVFDLLQGSVIIIGVTIRGGSIPPDQQGGGINIDTANVLLFDVVVRNNEAVEEGGGIANFNGQLIVQRSSIIDNFASCGGGVFNDGALARLEHVTVSGNDVFCIGGGLLDGGFFGTTEVSYSTFVNNTPENIAGTQDTLTLDNTLLVPFPGFANCDILSGGGSIDAGGNFAGSEDCDTIVAAPGAELVQARMQDADSGQFVHRPLVGNPAIDNAFGACPPTDPFDQRGVARPENALCDSGAVEIRPAAFTSGAPADATWNVPYTHTATASGEGPFSFALQAGTLPNPLSLSPAGVISGTPLGLATSPFTIRLTDDLGQTADQATSITVTGTAASVTGAPPAAPWNTAYLFPFSGTGNGVLTYAVTAGSLPAGLAMSSGGVVSGTPSGGLGTSVFTVTVTDQTAQVASLVDASVTVTGVAASVAGTPPGATWNTAYNFTFGGTGNGTRTYTIIAGNLPAGLAMSTAGVISGTPTGLGTASFTVRVTDQAGQTSPPFATGITVTGTTASISGTPPGATWNSPYSFQFTGAGNGTLSYAITAGNLPAGLTMSTGGAVTGTPTGVGTSSFTVTLTDQTGLQPATPLATSITVTGTPASISGTPPGATWNTAYNFTFSGTGNGTLTYTIIAGNLPAGLAMSTTGVISGTPTGVTPGSFTVRVTDQSGQTSPSLATSITVTGTPASISGTPPAATWNTAYAFTFTAAGNGTLTYALTMGTLPAGLALSSGGAITGTPTGSLVPSSFRVTVTDQTGVTASLDTSITVTGTNASVSGTPPPANWNTSYQFAFTGTGNGTLTFTLTAGALPAGLSLATSGRITGTPTAVGVFTFNVTVTDQTSQVAHLVNASLTVTGTSASIAGTPPAGTWGVAYNFAFTGTGSGTLSYAVTVGSLPAGLSLSTSGVISGSPTAVGNASFTVTLTDQAGQTTTLSTSVSVSGSGATIAGTPPGATWGVAYAFAFTGTGNGTLTYARTAGTLPPGLSLSSAGVLSGTPTALGTSSFTVTVTDATSQTASRSTSIMVTGTPISLTGDPSPAIVDSSYAFAFTATGNGALTFNLEGGVLPAGITFAGGVLSGTPLTAGSFPLTVRVTDATAQTTARVVSLVVVAAPAVPPAPPPPPPAGNAPPTISGLSNITIEENRPIPPMAITLFDDATSPDQLAVTVVPADATILSDVSLTGTGGARTLHITLAEDREGQASVTLNVSDGSLSTTATVHLTVTPAPVPGPPTGLTAVPDGDGLRFSWIAPATGAVPTFFVLEGGSQPGTVTLPIVNSGRATSFRTVVPAGLWYFRVRSGNSAGTSIPSAEIAGNISPSVTNPGAPQALVSSTSGVVAQLAWQPPLEGGAVDAWQIELGSRPGLSDRVVVRVPATTFGVQSALDPGQYVARIRGVGPGGEGPASNETSFTIGAIAPCALGVADPPVLLPATVAANRLVTLTWRAPTNSAVRNYRIIVGTAPGLANLVTFDVGGVTSFAAVAPPGHYFVTLLASNDCGASLPSNSIFVTVP